MPNGAASATPATFAHTSAVSGATTDREKAAPLSAPDSKANDDTGSFCRPDTPSLTSPTERPDSNTINTPINATTEPIKAKRPRAKDNSRKARNMTNQCESYGHHVDKHTGWRCLQIMAFVDDRGFVRCCREVVHAGVSLATLTGSV